MASGFVRQSAKRESSTCKHGRPQVTSAALQIGFAFGFWTHSLETDEWSGFSWLKPGL